MSKDDKVYNEAEIKDKLKKELPELPDEKKERFV